MITFDLEAQDCDPDVPHLEVDLSSQPDAVFSSPMISRQGNCCGTSNPDRCIAFTITLHEDAEGILFDVCDGAAPSGSLYYQVGCGPQQPVGEVLCLDGPGPHYLTFCKPGNNDNVYCITSVPAPSAGPAQVASEGCTADISATGYDPTTVTWTSVFPGLPGEFDDQLSCTSCLSSTVTAPINFPPYVDYMICGLAVGGCSSLSICDTVRVHFVSNLNVTIEPIEPAICFGSTGTEVTASGVGGFPPYTFTWSNGSSGATTWIEEPGTYSVEITDDSGCPPASYEFEVTEYDLPLEVNAGADILVCSASEDVQLNGYFEGIESAVWEGGNGIFTPDRNDPLAVYSPTATEIESGSLQLILALHPLGSCPSAFDSLNIQFSTFEATVLTESNPISCFGLTDGSIALAAEGNGQPFSIEWSDPTLSGWSVDNLPSGSYTATITDSIGCSAEYTFDITEPEPLELQIAELENVSCHGGNDGSVALTVTGGIPDYTFLWYDDNGEGSGADNLSPGDYTVSVEDANECTTEIIFEIAAPDPLTITVEADSILCYGENLDISATVTGGTGNYTYHWNENLSDADEHTVSPEVTTTYTIFATDENGCETAAIELPVEVVSMDEDLLSVNSGAPVCAGSFTTVEAFYDGAYPPYTYSWSHGLPDGPGPHNVNPDETTTYTVTVTDDCSNQVEKEVEVIIYPLPEISVDINHITCFGNNDGTATLNVSGGTAPFTFDWSNGGNESAAENLTPGTYSVVVTDAESCTGSVSFSIDEPSLLELEASADDLICPDEDVTLSAIATGGTGEYTYHWNENLSDATEHTVSPEVTTTFTVFATDENGCETAAIELPVEVVSMDEDLLSVNPGEPICAGESTAISAFYFGAHPPYTYSWSHGLPAESGPHDVSPEETTTYSVTVSDYCGNEVTGEVTVVVNPLPELSLQNVDDVTCYGLNNGIASVSVASGTPGYQYMWSGSESNSHSVNDLAPGNHQVTVSDYHECLDSLQFVIAEPEPLSLSATSDTLVCPGDSVLLSANASGGIGGYTYNWSHSNDENAEQTVAVNSNSNFTVQAVDANGCVSETDVLEVNVISMTTDLLSTISGDPACLGESTTVAAQYSGAHPPYSYQWSNGLPSTPGPHVVSPTESFTYSVTVTDQCGNSVEGEVPVEILPLPVVDLPSMLAEGCEDLRVTFTDTINDVSNNSWVWSINDDLHFTGNTLNHIFTEPGLHTVDLSVTSFDGCETASANSSLVIVKPSPTAAFTATPWEMEINEPEVTFTDQSEGNETWLWHFGDNNQSNLQNPVYTYSDTGTYLVTLIVENEHQCTDSVSRYILVKPSYNIIIPNAFTPTDNNNGYYDPTNPNNDIFYPFADYVQEFRMTIFNRWGEVIFESTEMNRGWNGWYRGEPCAQDVYVYKIEFVFSDGAEITKVGDITLFR